MKVWFYSKGASPERVSNFGDVLTPFILDHYGIKWEESPLSLADTFFVGSIIKKVTPNSTVYGSGIMSKTDRIELAAKYKWVRGPLTRECIINAGGECPELYGDPALLLSKMIDTNVNKVAEVGYTPHYVDYNNYSNYANVIKLDDTEPLRVAKTIASYEKIISASLHGSIAAHALNIPAAWVPCSGVKGDGSKFYDHYRSVGLEPIQSSLRNPVFQVPEKIETDHIENILKGI